ncbi:MULTISPECIES: GDP-mannose 4,6-dehydratase [Pantoea]|uniref:GDP-mannose 4,6-dehydratase n=1 Tax=Pantoea TaxID=53335 RepID=UPI0007369C57|nr:MULTISPECIES: GDP-mannose 4,6-dehydratase [Pantoea]KTS01184.1 GDP-6-deoxy-D-lyxo-4-hexulose reductase [Pantoea dispersa]MBU6517949.1 GDP-mannose 4,6-dehydratase [Pantoea sp. B270]NIG36548.1 NAD-dependent epimerase/dehydratase family protein [Pantoea sp. Ap-959]PPC65156.1 GDP-mannose 4,6 dehydratase [Pantoea sp. ICBG 828]
MTNGKKALITGIKGFTGHYMAAELSAAGYDVYGLGSASSDNIDNYFQVDLTDNIQVKNAVDCISPDVVVHLAAIAFVGHSNPNAFYDVNLSGTRNLLSALTETKKKPEAVLVASSANVYGNNIAGKLDESTLPNPANDYAVSKLAMEYMANLFKDKLPLIITRPFNYTGVGQAENFLIPKIVKHFRERKDVIELGNIDVWRDFSDVRDLVKCYAELLKCKAFGEVVNVATGEMHSLRDVISLCEDITGHSITIEVNPGFVRPNEIKELCGDISLLNSLIGHEMQKVPLRETLKWMLETKS